MESSQPGPSFSPLNRAEIVPARFSLQYRSLIIRPVNILHTRCLYHSDWPVLNLRQYSLYIIYNQREIIIKKPLVRYFSVQTSRSVNNKLILILSCILSAS